MNQTSPNSEIVRHVKPGHHRAPCHPVELRRPHGFTLIELLVVIAIIAVLMGILMPSLQKVRKMAQATTCRFHLKEWGTIFHLYAADNENKLPQSIAGEGLNAQEAYWIVATLPYYSEKKNTVSGNDTELSGNECSVGSR